VAEQPARTSDRPLVSVLIPSYNHDRFIAETIETVCAQTHQPLELIVVDDGSTDGTASVVESVAPDARRRLDRFVFVQQRANRGITRTLNRALREARGEFVAVVGSDDVCLPCEYERLVDAPAWANARTAAVFGDAIFIDEHGRRVGVLHDHSTTDLADPEAETLALAHYTRWRREPEPGPLGSYRSLLRGMYVPMVSTLFRRSAVRAAGNFDERYFIEDYPLLLKLARDQVIDAIPDVLAKRRLHGGNASLVDKRAVFREFLELMVRERRHARRDPVADAERAGARDRAYHNVRYYGNAFDLVRVVARHPFAGPSELLAARRRQPPGSS
jgi:alpha-1,3-rhamnosyltransferase